MSVKTVPFKMDPQTAEAQAKLVEKAIATLEESRELLQKLGESQNATLWTDDGKSIALAAALRSKYDAAIKWYEAIRLDLDEAATNLLKAIEETTELDETSKQNFRTLLYRAEGPSGLSKTIAV